MPIYEFRCLKCHQIVEFLFSSSQDQHEIKCPHCGGRELDRVLSRAARSRGRSSGAPETEVETRTCGEGTCTTLEIPGRGD